MSFPGLKVIKVRNGFLFHPEGSGGGEYGNSNATAKSSDDIRVFGSVEELCVGIKEYYDELVVNEVLTELESSEKKSARKAEPSSSQTQGGLITPKQQFDEMREMIMNVKVDPPVKVTLADNSST